MMVTIDNPMGDPGTLMVPDPDFPDEVETSGDVAPPPDPGVTVYVSAEIIDLDAPDDGGVYMGDGPQPTPWIIDIDLDLAAIGNDPLMLTAYLADTGDGATSEYVELPGFGSPGSPPAAARQRRAAADSPEDVTLQLDVPVPTQGTEPGTENVTFTVTKDQGTVGIVHIIGRDPDTDTTFYTSFTLGSDQGSVTPNAPVSVPVLPYLSVVAVLPRANVYRRRTVHRP